MLKIGDYDYPNEVTFSEALSIANTAISKFEGKISNKDVAEAMGYKIKNPNAISGYIFRKFDDICAYNLMKRERGYLTVTSTATDALDPYDTRKSDVGKAQAIRQMPIVIKAFTDWKGDIPQETAFPSKLVDLLGISWQEAQKHTESLRKLFIEVFPYLKATAEITTAQAAGSRVGGGDVVIESEAGTMTISARAKDFGFTKSLPFSKKGIQTLKELINFLETQVSEEENQKTAETRNETKEKN